MHDYFSAGAAEQFQFFRIPKALIHNEEFRALSCDAKLLYGLLLDRMSLSERNGWRDALGRVYIFYTQKAISADLGCCQETVRKLMTELEQAGLIERRKLGQGKPCRIYVKQFSTGDENAADKTTEVQASAPRKNRGQEHGNTAPNHTEYNQTELSYTDPSSGARTEEEIREQLEYEILRENNHGHTDMVDAIVSVIAEAERSSAKTLRVGGADLPRERVVAALRELDFTHVEYVLDCMEESRPNIRNIRAYLLTALYNAPATIEAYYAAKVAHDWPNLSA